VCVSSFCVGWVFWKYILYKSEQQHLYIRDAGTTRLSRFEGSRGSVMKKRTSVCVCVCVCGKQGGWKERELVIPKRLTEEHQQTWRAKLILFAQSLKT